MELENIELINAAENIAEEKGIEKDLIFKAIEDAISKASKTKYTPNDSNSQKIDVVKIPMKAIFGLVEIRTVS